MITYGRSCIAASMACLILIAFAAPAYPSYNREAAHQYSVASRRLEDLRKSPKKKKYRSYWMDCIRTFELVERKYPKSPSAADACFDRAALYFELYHFSRYSRDIDKSMTAYGKCQSSYPKHQKAPEALYRIINLSVKFKKNRTAASRAYTKLKKIYSESPWTEQAKTKLGGGTVKKKPVPAIRKMPVPVISSGKPVAAGVVQNIRYWSGGAYTRIVIDQDQQLKYQIHELKEPDRLVFDLMNARIGDSIDRELPVNDGILKQVRAGQYDPETVRVVLDLASIRSYMAFPLHDPDRLVIDVTGERSSDVPFQGAEAGGQQKQENSEQQVDRKGVLSAGQKMVIPPVKIPASNTEGRNLSLSRQLGLKVRTIAIDAGHGGHDPGAMGKRGLKEKNITLDIAKRLSALIKDRLGCKVVMTREKDIFIPLEERPFLAKSKGADLFVSIHVNANRRRTARGVETYVQSLTASDREAMATAARENAMSTKKLSELKTELDRIFADLTRDNKIEESMYLADAIQGSMVNYLKPVNRHVGDLKSRVKRAFFYVLINTEMPSILAEVGFISNPTEEKLLRKASYRQSIAEAIYLGVKKYVDSRSVQPMGV